MKSRSNATYPLLVLCGALLFSLGGVLVKRVPWSSMAISGCRSLIAAAEIALYMKLRHHPFVFNRSVLLGGVSMAATSILYVFANKLTTAANAVLIQYMAPVFIIFMIWAIFREPPSFIDIGATVVITLGVVCFFLESLSGGGLLGDLLALGAAATYAVVFMMRRFHGSDTLSSVLLGCLIGGGVGLPWLLTEPAVDQSSLFGILLLGLLQFGGGYLCMAEGLRGTPPLTASLISMVEPIANPILVALVVHETIGPLAMAGAVVVVVGVVVYNILSVKVANKA